MLNNVGNDGNFWSPVADGPNDARNANFNVNGNANPSNNDNRNNGNSVRCVARPVAGSISEEGGGGGGPKGPNN